MQHDGSVGEALRHGHAQRPGDVVHPLEQSERLEPRARIVREAVDGERGPRGVQLAGERGDHRR